MWNKVYEKEFIFAPECYKSCNSYCCNNFFGEYFSFLDKEAVILPLIDEEYEVYKKRGGIKNITETKKEITFNDNKKLTLYLLKCKEHGLCSPHNNRPFICRIYPYLPKVDLEGNIEGLLYASLIDNIIEKNYHPCPLTKQNDIKEELLNNLKDIKFTPKTILALKLAELLIIYLQKEIKEFINEKNKALVIKKFEKIFLGNKIFKNEQFKKEANEIYMKMKKRYGEFL